MADYQYVTGPFGIAVQRRADGAVIPADPANADWLAFLAWEALGNNPDAVTVATPPTIIDMAVYVGRFTAGEWAAIQTFSLTAPPIPASLACYNYLFQLTVNRAIPLNGPGVLAMHVVFVNRGFLTLARSASILTP